MATPATSRRTEDTNPAAPSLTATRAGIHDQLRELKWLQGGVLTIHALMSNRDATTLMEVAWASVAFLVDQMHACAHGALQAQIDTLEQRIG